MAGTTLGASAVLGLGEAAIGFLQQGQANKKAKELAASRPKLAPSQYLKDDLSLAESDLSNGMSAEAKTAYESDMDKSLSSSLGAITRMGGSPNDVGSVFANSATGRARLAIMKDNLRLSKITNLSRARSASEEEREKEFQFNEWAPWADKAQANAQAKQTAQSEIYGGLNTVGAGVMRFGQEKSSEKMFANYFNQKAPQASGGGATTPPPAGAESFLDGLLTNDE